MTTTGNSHSVKHFGVFATIGFVLFVFVALTSDPMGNYLGIGPGLTIDESFNVQQGVYLIEVTKQLGPFVIFPENIGEVFNPENGFLPDHPPLARWWLGAWHHITMAMFPPEKPASTQVVIACGRVGSAAAYGLLVAIIGIFTTRWFGFTSGLLACLSYALMPRVFGHAHIASIETFLNLTYFLAIAVIVDQWKEKAPLWKTALWTGVFMGLALLTKIQAVFIPIPVIMWAIWRYRLSALQPLLIWGVTAWVVFFVGWPWLWLDPIGHTLKFLGSSTDRVPLNVYYLGQIFIDKQAPWHYPWVMTLVTLPLATLLTGGLGVGLSIPRRKIDPRLLLLSASALFPLIVFTLPVAKYDGERLFLIAFPFWAVLSGVAWSWLTERMTWSTPKTRLSIAVLIVTLSALAIPFSSRSPLAWLNILGRPFSSSFENDYWAFDLTTNRHDVLVKLEQDGKTKDGVILAVTPELHQFQIVDLNEQQGKLSGESSEYMVKFISVSELESQPQLTQLVDGLVTFDRRANPPDWEKLSKWFEKTDDYFHPAK